MFGDGLVVTVAIVGGVAILALLGVGAVAVMRNQRAAVALRDSERRLRTLVEHAPEALVVLDVDRGRFVEVNANAARLYGRSRVELLAMGPVDVSPPTQPDGQSSAELAKRHLAAALAGQTPVFEWVHQHSSGEAILCEIRLVRLPAADRRLVRGSVIDIRERKRVEEELRRSEELFSKAFRSVPDSITITTLDEGKLVEVNDGFTAITGHERAEVIGRSVTDIGLWLSDPEREQFVASLRAAGRVRSIETRFRMKSGAVRNFLVSAELVHFAGAPHLLAVSTDITEMKRAAEERQELEAQLRQAHKMEAIGRLAGGIAHDFNNLLLAILGYGELARDDLPANSPARRSVDQIIAAARRAQEVVRQILAFSRRGDSELRRVNLRDVVHEALRFLRVTLPSNIEIRESCGDDPDPVLVDAGQIHEVLLNLGANAAQAIGNRDGVLDVSIAVTAIDADRAMRIGDLRPGRFVHLAISDNGDGMDQETIDRMFDPFFTTKQRGDGAGLGLSVVHGIVVSHRGGIQVASSRGGGTTFNIFLPLADTDEAQRASLDGGAAGSERVLFVDDDEMIADLAHDMLGRLGYAVTAETNPERALDRVMAAPDAFDIMIVDFAMPRMSGIALAKRCKEIRPTMPILLATGYRDAETEKQVLQSGIDGWLAKPYSGPEMGSLIRRTLERR